MMCTCTFREWQACDAYGGAHRDHSVTQVARQQELSPVKLPQPSYTKQEPRLTKFFPQHSIQFLELIPRVRDLILLRSHKVA